MSTYGDTRSQPEGREIDELRAERERLKAEVARLTQAAERNVFERKADLDAAERSVAVAKAMRDQRNGLIVELDAALAEVARLEGKLAWHTERLFRILGDRKVGAFGIPWRLIAPFEEQALKNHNQTLARLHERGGLSPREALCVIKGLKWDERKLWADEAVAKEELLAWVRANADEAAAERELCAQLAAESPHRLGCNGGTHRALANDIADAIRARGGR